MAERREKPLARALADNAPWKPPAWSEEQVGALQALLRGDAAAHQQKLALAYIIENLSGAYDMHYRPAEDGRRDTDFALGRAFVGQQIVKLLKLHLPALRRPEP